MGSRFRFRYAENHIRIDVTILNEDRHVFTVYQYAHDRGK